MTEPTVREGVNLGVELDWIHPQPSALQGVQCIYVTEYLQLLKRMVTVVTWQSRKDGGNPKLY